MDAPTAARAARAVADARLGRVALDRLPAALAPQSEDDGYAIQDALHPLLSATGLGPVVGHKIGCTTAVMQAYIGLDHPAGGRVFAAGVHDREARVRHGDYVRPGVECEVAVELGRDVTSDDIARGPSGVRDAVAAAMVAIEIVDDRYVDHRTVGAPMLVADDFFGAGGVLGPRRRLDAEVDLQSVSARMLVDGEPVGEGHGRDILGDPLAALVWLAGELARRSSPLRAGEIVFLGSVVTTQWVAAGSIVEVESPELGRATAWFE